MARLAFLFSLLGAYSSASMSPTLPIARCHITEGMATVRGIIDIAQNARRMCDYGVRAKFHISDVSVEQSRIRYRVFLAVGSNIGDRYENIVNALKLLCTSGSTKMLGTSFLYRTKPMYVESQAAFLNGAVEIETALKPHSLLQHVKRVEKVLGRNFTEIKNGPRSVDLDLLFYDQMSPSKSDDFFIDPLLVDSSTLIVPHPMMQDRDFVLIPLQEVAGKKYVHPILKVNIESLLQQLQEKGEKSTAVRCLCLPRGRMLSFDKTLIMGILNVTPDSFSDGGKWNSSIEMAASHAFEMEKEGADVIDIGGESTRPGADEISIEEQIKRTVAVIQRIREVSDIPISIDTRSASVAEAAIAAGADIVNDVSGGTYDSDMFATVARHRVPIILVHMRGTPKSMQSLTAYNNVVREVGKALLHRSRAAEEAGIPRWQQVLDPGIGFAKDQMDNLSLLKNVRKIREAIGDIPMLLGTSRKGFIGNITNVSIAQERDYGTISSCVTALCLGDDSIGCNILRVHNVKATKNAVDVMDAIKNAK